MSRARRWDCIERLATRRNTMEIMEIHEEIGFLMDLHGPPW